MKRALRALAAGVAAAAGVGLWSAAAQAQNPYGCACLNNLTQGTVHYRFHWGNDPWQTMTLQRGQRAWMCWQYAPGTSSSPPLQFQLDVDLSQGSAWTTYAIERVQSPARDCDRIGTRGQYDVRYRPNTNNSFLHVTRRQ